MIDLHSHILPGLDDGAQDIYDTLEMVRLAARSGITAMVATPHCNIPGRYENYFGDQYVQTIERVRKAVHAERLPVQILPGVEAFATPDLPRLLKEGKIMPLNQSRYLLMEFDFAEDPEFAKMITEEIKDCGVIPVIAHPERYDFVRENPDIVYHWRSAGYPIQINKGSLQGRFGRSAARIAHLLMEHHLVSAVASDAHSPYQRTPYMAEAYEELLAEYPDEHLRMLFYENPRRICQNEPILSYRPKRIESWN